MTNKDIIIEFIGGNQRYNAVNHIGYQLNKLYNYSTLMCDINRGGKKARVNVHKYGNATTKIQAIIRQVLTDKGYSIEEFDGGYAVPWNGGEIGAARYVKSDFAI